MSDGYYRPLSELLPALEGLTSAKEVYAKYLTTIEWKVFRDKIVGRDGNRCRHCNEEGGEKEVPIQYTEAEREKVIHQAVLSQLKVRRLVHGISKSNELFNENDEYRKAVNTVMKSSPDSNFKIRKNVLNVHHTYYIDGKFPWDYPEESLLTLCVSCHKKVHEDAEIPVYRDDRLEEIIDYWGSCPRCAGTGFLHQYYHVQSGICFQCGGTGSDN